MTRPDTCGLTLWSRPDQARGVVSRSRAPRVFCATWQGFGEEACVALVKSLEHPLARLTQLKDQIAKNLSYLPRMVHLADRQAHSRRSMYDAVPLPSMHLGSQTTLENPSALMLT